MKIIQIIKAFFNRRKIKKIEAPKEIIQEEIKENVIKSNEENNIFIIPKIEKRELTKGEKVKEILKTIGCEKEIFDIIKDFEYINVELLKNNIKLLTELEFSKYQISKILTQNFNLLYTPNEYVKQSIEKLKEYLKDINIIKEVIFMNPYVLSYENEKYIEETKEAFLEKDIDIKMQVNLIEENSNILSLGKEKLKNSLDLILEIAKDNKRFKDLLNLSPILIGCNDSDTIKRHIINEI